ncbi:MAG: hypothetical protein WAO00_03615 [Chthoniobacterales bacterium]
MQPSSTARLQIGPLLLAAVPLASLIWFYLYVLRQRVLLGYWPRPYEPDPKTAGLFIHHMSVYYSFLAVPIAVLAAACWLAGRRMSDPSYRWGRTAVFLALSVTIWITVLALDPGKYFEWFLD